MKRGQGEERERERENKRGRGEVLFLLCRDQASLAAYLVSTPLCNYGTNSSSQHPPALACSKKYIMSERRLLFFIY